MSRTIPSALLTALGQTNVAPFYAVEFDFDTAPVRFWTGYGERGVGDVISASQIVSGQNYVIASVGSTNFTAIGANSNVVGQSFIATGAGSGTGTVQFAYIGAGSLIGISGLEEVGDLSAKSATISLSGVPTELVSLALQEPYQNRACRILFGVVDVTEVIEVFGGFMDTMDIEDSGDSSIITLTVESKLVQLERSKERRYTHESQQPRYSGDTFFSFVSDLQDKDVIWGRSSA